MLRTLYDRLLAAAGHRHAPWWLALVAFAESSIFPVPPDVLLLPMVLAARHQWLRFATICTLASVVGGVAGYAIGAFLFETVGRPLIDLFGQDGTFEAFRAKYNEFGAWIVFSAGLTPLPYKVVTIASGAVRLDLIVFILASVLARGLRFFIVAGALWYFGPIIRLYLERYLWLASFLILAAAVGAMALAKVIL